MAAVAAAAVTGCAGSPLSGPEGSDGTVRGATGSARAVEHTPVDVPGAASCADIPQAPAAGPVKDGLPALRLECLTAGPAVDLAAVRGRPVLVNLWATWCGPCREEMPLLQSTSEQHAGAVQFLGVDTKDRPAAAARFLAEVGVTYPNVVDPDGDLLAHLRLPGLPVTLLLDAEGRLVGKHIGQLKQASLDDLLARLP